MDSDRWARMSSRPTPFCPCGPALAVQNESTRDYDPRNSLRRSELTDDHSIRHALRRTVGPSRHSSGRLTREKTVARSREEQHHPNIHDVTLSLASSHRGERLVTMAPPREALAAPHRQPIRAVARQETRNTVRVQLGSGNLSIEPLRSWSRGARWSYARLPFGAKS